MEAVWLVPIRLLTALASILGPRPRRRPELLARSEGHLHFLFSHHGSKLLIPTPSKCQAQGARGGDRAHAIGDIAAWEGHPRSRACCLWVEPGRGVTAGTGDAQRLGGTSGRGLTCTLVCVSVLEAACAMLGPKETEDQRVPGSVTGWAPCDRDWRWGEAGPPRSCHKPVVWPRRPGAAVREVALSSPAGTGHSRGCPCKGEFGQDGAPRPRAGPGERLGDGYVALVGARGDRVGPTPPPALGAAGEWSGRAPDRPTSPPGCRSGRPGPFDDAVPERGRSSGRVRFVLHRFRLPPAVLTLHRPPGCWAQRGAVCPRQTPATLVLQDRDPTAAPYRGRHSRPPGSPAASGRAGPLGFLGT